MKIKILLTLVLPFLLFTGFKIRVVPDQGFIYLNPKYNIHDRINDLLTRMTHEEKIKLLRGTEFSTLPIKRLHIPELNISDGNLFHEISMAATWNPDLIYRTGQNLGRDLRARGKNVLLGPSLDNGSFGEDPFLTSRIAVNYIKGVQSENVAATIEYFPNLNEEININKKAYERIFNELYLPSFEASITEANVFCINSVYNGVLDFRNENNWFLSNLKNEWSFKGLILSNEEIISTNFIDDKVSRLLSVMFRLGMFDKKQKQESENLQDKEVTLQTAKESIVLLKNDNILPLKEDKIKNISIIGLQTQNLIKQYKFLMEQSGINVKVQFEKGYIQKDFEERAAAKSVSAESGRDLLSEALKISKDADIVLFFAGTPQVTSCKLPGNQNKLINSITRVNKNVVVILSTAQGVSMPWKDNVKGIIETWTGGEEIPTALTDIIKGKYNPSGKLPLSFTRDLTDYYENSNYNFSSSCDGILVGYRLYDKMNIEPLFPFGYGLSYTNFNFSNLALSCKQISPEGNIRVSLDITNTGTCEGAETVQLYINDVQCSVVRPEKELKGFQKVFLKPNESKKVEFTIDKSLLSFYDIKNHTWKCEQGEFNILIGSSSRDIKLKGQLILK